MKKNIIFSAILAATVFIAVLEVVSIGLPEPNLITLSICSSCLWLGLIYMKLSLYKLRDLLWCLVGGLGLTTFVLVSEHLLYGLPPIIDYFNLGALASLVLCVLIVIFVTAVYAFSLYTFVFYFCNVGKKIHR